MIFTDKRLIFLIFMVFGLLFCTKYYQNAQDIEEKIDHVFQVELFKRQEKERQRIVSKTGNLPDLIYSLVPQLTCQNLVRVGKVTDGGKWMCNPWRARKNCIIYSFGVGNDISWEQELLTLNPTCLTFSFDPNANYANLFPKNDTRLVFRPYRLATETNLTESKVTFDWVLENFSHTRVDFLKVDIERDEFETIPQILQSGIGPKVPICNIFIEIHQKLSDQVGSFRDLMKLIEKSGYLMYAREVLFCGYPCSEYSFIHRKCFSEYGMKNERKLGYNFAVDKKV